MRKRCSAVPPLRIAFIFLLAVACVGCVDRAEMRRVAARSSQLVMESAIHRAPKGASFLEQEL